MFSSRTPSNLVPNRVSVALAARGRRALPILDLTASNPTTVALSYPEAEILDALRDPRALTYAPAPRGLAEAREAIAAHHATQGYAIDPEHLALAASTSEAYGWLFKLLCEPGDEVLVPRPSYPLFECLASLESVKAVQFPLDAAASWRIDLDTLETLVTPRTRVVLLVNPNNPTGSFLKPRDHAAILDIAARRGLAVVSDEVFFDYCRDGAAPRVSALSVQADVLVFTLSGLSKVAGLPQMKLGWIHVGGPPALRGEALSRLDWIADAYLPVSAPVQHAARRWLSLAPRIRHVIQQRCEAGREVLLQSFPAESGCRLLPAEGGWAAIIEVPRIRSEEEWVLYLLEGPGVLVQPGYFYDFEREAYLVCSLLVQPPDLVQGARAIRNALRG